MVPTEAIGDKGRDVRCKKCGHTWFQKSEKETLDALINRIQSSPNDEDDISFEDLKKVARPRGNVQKKPDTALKKLLLSMRSDDFLKRAASVSVAAAIVSVVLFGCVSGRGMIAKIVPFVSPVYTALGFPMSIYADVNPEEALVLEKMELVSDSSGSFMKGHLINLTSAPVRLPILKVTYTGTDGKAIKEDIYTLKKAGKAGLAKEENIAISVPVSAKMLESVVNIDIRFAESAFICEKASLRKCQNL